MNGVSVIVELKIIMRTRLSQLFPSVSREKLLSCQRVASANGVELLVILRDTSRIYHSVSYACVLKKKEMKDIHLILTHLSNFSERNNLNGTIISEIGSLKDLEVLSLEQGYLRGTIPSTIGTLSKLLIIDLDYNRLSGSLPEELYNVTTLLQLDLNNNLLTGTLSKEVENYHNLIFLQLQNNHFEGTLPSSLGSLEKLKLGEFYGNDFSGFMPQEVCLNRDSEGGMIKALTADCFGAVPKLSCECCSACAISN